MTQTVQQQIQGLEKAIRLIIGERKALNSKLSRLEARLKLERSRLPHKSMPIGERFPDFSSYQSNVDLKAVHGAASLRVGDLAFTKLTEGIGWTDPTGAPRLATMANLGFLRRGAYHFGRPEFGGVAQAEHFLNSGGAKLGKNDIACYDCEVSDGSQHVAQSAKDFAATVAKHTPAELWLYGGGPFLREFGVSLDGFAWHWLAAYVGNPAPYMVFGSARTRAWQYTDGVYGPSPHACPGVGGCDMSVVLK